MAERAVPCRRRRFASSGWTSGPASRRRGPPAARARLNGCAHRSAHDPAEVGPWAKAHVAMARRDGPEIEVRTFPIISLCRTAQAQFLLAQNCHVTVAPCGRSCTSNPLLSSPAISLM